MDFSRGQLRKVCRAGRGACLRVDQAEWVALVLGRWVNAPDTACHDLQLPYHCVCGITPALLGRAQLPLLEAIHEYLKKANDHGSISRQEAVSMVPPLFLDVQPHHKVETRKKGGGVCT
jgi:16S rRNA C967 or C1407 C5-methylase (RsmB/RsmF family)